MGDIKDGSEFQGMIEDGGQKQQKAKVLPQLFLVSVAGVGTILFGITFGFSSPTGPKLVAEGKLVGHEQESWYSSIVLLGAMLGAIIAAVLADMLGRKKALILVAVPSILGWGLMALCFHAEWTGPKFYWTLLAGRFLTGMAGGENILVCPAYIAETSSKELRGLFGSSIVFKWNFGILLVNALGIPMSNGWLAVVPLVLSFVSGALLLLMPDSPTWLLKKGREEEARKAMTWLRGKDYAIESEIKDIQDSLDVMGRQRLSLSDMKQRNYYKPLIIGIFLGCLQLGCGLVVAVAYSNSIIIAAGFQGEPGIISVVTGIILMVFVLPAAFLVDRLGRRFFLILSASLCCVSMFLIGLYFFLTIVKGIPNLAPLSVTGILVFFISFSLGLGPVVFVLFGELLPLKLRTIGFAVVIIVAYIIGFVITKEFLSMQQTLTSYGTFWLFSGINLFGAISMAIFVPETKGKSLEEIEAFFKGESNPKPQLITEKEYTFTNGHSN